MEPRKPSANLADPSLLLVLAHRLILLRLAGCRIGGSRRCFRRRRIVRTRRVLANEAKKLVEHLIREFVDVELDFVFVHSLGNVSHTIHDGQGAKVILTLRFGMLSRMIFNAVAILASGRLLIRLEMSCFCS